MAIAEVGAGSQRAVGADSAVSISSKAFPGSVTQNNLLIVAGTCWLDTPGNTSLTVTDTRSTSYTVLLGPGIVWAGGTSREFIAYGIAPSSGACTVTLDPDGTDNWLEYVIDEFSGVDTTTPLDVDGGEFTGLNTTPSGTIALNTNGALVIGSACNDYSAGAWTAGSGYTLLANDPSEETFVPFAVEFQIFGSAGTKTVDFTMTNSRSWGVQLAAFQVVQTTTRPYSSWSQLAPILAQ